MSGFCFSDEKQKTYTYFVGENDVLVHNMCATNFTKLSNKSIGHISKHSFASIQQQASYLTDQQLANKLVNTTFFSKNWTPQQIAEYTQEAYNILLSQNKIGATTAIKIHGEIIKVAIDANGVFQTAFGLYKYVVEDFR